MNELLFCAQSLLISICLLAALKVGLEALVTMSALCAILANIVVTKQITLCGLEVTTADSLCIGVICALNLINEYWGKRVALKALGITLASSLCTVMFLHLHLLFIPNTFDASSLHFNALFIPVERMFFISFICFAASQTIDYGIYSLLKRYRHLYFLQKNWLSLSLSQLIDTCLFTLMAFWNMPYNKLHIIVVSYAVKLASFFIMTPLFLYINSIKPRKKIHEAVEV